MSDDKLPTLSALASPTPSSSTPTPSRSWLSVWGSKRPSSTTLLDEKQLVQLSQPLGPNATITEAGVTSNRTSDGTSPREADSTSPRSLMFRTETDNFSTDLARKTSAKSLEEVLNMLTLDKLPELPSKPDARLACSILDALHFISTSVDDDKTSEDLQVSISTAKHVLDRLADVACQQFGSVFLRGLEPVSLVRLFRSEIAEIRIVALSFFSRLYTIDRPWTMSHRERRPSMMEALVHAVNAESAESIPAHLELYEAVQLFLTSSILNSVSDIGPDPALEMFEAERGYDAMMNVVEKNPNLSEPLLDCLRCLTFLGGQPKEFEEAFRQSKVDNSDEPVSEAKNPASFAAVARLVSKMLSASPDQEQYNAIRLPLLHCVMSVYSSNPKNFGILERQFQILSQLSRRVGEPDLHDELLFMTVKLFELVALGLEYRPVTAVTVLCDVSLPALAKRGDARTFNVLGNTLVKLLQRHASLALDCGLLKNLIFPQISAAAKAPVAADEDRGLLLDCLVILASCLERHASSSSSMKAGVFKSNCAAARSAGIGSQCKDIILARLKLETEKDIKSPVITAAVSVLSLLAKDDPELDLTWILELIQNPVMSQSRTSVRFRSALFESAHIALQANRSAWGGTAGFDCVLTVLLSLESCFARPPPEAGGEDDSFKLLRSALGFLNQSAKQAESRKHIEYEALFSVVNMTSVLQCPKFATSFVAFVLQSMVLSLSGSSVEDVEPLVLLGAFSQNTIEEKAQLSLFEKLSEMVANDGEFSSWNRQQLARFRIAEQIVQTYSEALVDPTSRFHSPLTRVVSCVGNHSATAELLDSLLRLAYRVAPGDADGKFELLKTSSSLNSLDGLASSGIAEVQPPPVSARAAANADELPSKLECVLRILQLVAEPKIIGRHAVLGRYPDDNYGTPCLEIPTILRKCWPPGSTGAVASGGISTNSYSFSSWVWITLGNSNPSIDLASLYSNSVLVFGVSLDVESDEGEGAFDGGLSLDTRRIVTVNTPNSTVKFEETPELYPGRWHHIVVVHRKTEQKNLVASFWSGNQDAKGGAGKVELYVNGAFVQSVALNWPQAIESTGWMSVRIGNAHGAAQNSLTNSRLRAGPTALFEGALTGELIAGLFMRGPSYRGSLIKISPMFQDRRAIIASAFERMHFLARDDDFINRIGGESSTSTGWRNVQKFASIALSARVDARSIATVFRFDPDFHNEPNLREIIPLPLQESLCSVGGASCTFLPLLLRVGASATLGNHGDPAHYHSPSVVSLVLSLMRDSLRSSDRARFDFRLEDGHRVMAWLLHLVCQSREKSDLELFRTALSFSITGTGFDSTVIDPEALFFIAMNDHVWRRNDSNGVSWELIAELLPWLNKLVHSSNRHRVLNFAALQPLNVFEWVLSAMILLVAENQQEVRRDGKDGFELLWQASILLESLLRCDVDSVPIVFQYTLVTLSPSSAETGEQSHETILHLLLRTNRLLSSLADNQGSQVRGLQASFSGPFSEQANLGKRDSITLDDLRCTLLDVLLRLRRPPPRVDKETGEAHAKKMSALYEKHGNGEWIGCIVDYACDDFESVRRILAFCENEFTENPGFARAFVNSKSFRVLSEAINGGKFANSPDVILFWARLVSGARIPTAEMSFAERSLRRAATSDISAGGPPFAEPGLRSRLDALVHLAGFGTSPVDPTFSSSAYDALHAILRDNITRNDETGVNKELIRFMWICAKNSSVLSKLWTTQACLKALVKTVFTYDMFGTHLAADGGANVSASETGTRSGATVETVLPATNVLDFLIDLIVWAVDPAEAYRLAASSFPDDVSSDRVASFQSKLYQGLHPHALQNPFLASVMVQRVCVGWTPGLEKDAVELALECKGVHLYQLRSVVLCAIDRNFASSEDEAILDFVLPQLPRLLAGGDADAYVGCLVRCVFSHALDQALIFTSPAASVACSEPSPAPAEAVPNEEDAAMKFIAWRFFTAVCCLAPDSMRKLLVTDDVAIQSTVARATIGLTKDIRMMWLREFGAPLRHLINQNSFMIWSREMERQAGKWFVPGRIPLSSGGGQGGLQMLMDMTRTNSEKTTAAGRVRGWTTPRDRSDTFFSTEKARMEKVLKARQNAFQKQEQLFFAKFEDLLRGKKSWSAILRKAQLPNSSWEPFGGRRLDLEEQHQRWKLDPFEDPSRARRRLRQNRTFYKRYNLVKVQEEKQQQHLRLKREASSSIASAPPLDLSGSQTDETTLVRLPVVKGSPWVRGKKRSSSLSTSPLRGKGKTPVVTSMIAPVDKIVALESTSGSPLNVIKALRKPQPFQRVRTHTLVTNSSNDAGEEEEDNGQPGIDETSTIESDVEKSGAPARKLDVPASDDEEDDFNEEDDSNEGESSLGDLDEDDEEHPDPVLFAREGEVKTALSPRLKPSDSLISESIEGDLNPSPSRKSTQNGGEDDHFMDFEGSTKPELGDEDPDYVIVDIRVRAHRERVKAEMDPVDRDSVTFKINCSTVRGLEERRGLCLIARTSLYVVDNYEVLPDGTIVEVDERPANFNVQVRQEDESMLIGDDSVLPSSSDVPAIGSLSQLVQQQQQQQQQSQAPSGRSKSVSHRKRRVRYDDILDVFRRRFLFRDVGLEIFSSDGSTLLVVMQTRQERDRLQLELKKARRKALLSVDLPFARAVSPPNDNVIASLSLDAARRRWIAGAISNFDYLTLLNTLAGRSYNDPAQYLVFPWVLADYESAELNLGAASSFRDLSKPMGALTEERVAYVTDRYVSLEASAESTGIPPFHFGTHYSCSGYVANFLFRLEPFSRMALQLQGGAFDRADRLFRSVDATWKSASGLNLNMQDVRELVPEFYCMHEFLENRNRFELGVTQRGMTVGDVELPAWAHGSAKEFIRLHRKALESKYVSEHLNEWIDLVFGYKQRGREAIKAINVFHPLTYEGEVDLDSITDPSEREATMEQIHSFGQTPTKLFESQPHPKKEVPPGENYGWHSFLAPPLVVPGNPDRPVNLSSPVSMFAFDPSAGGENPFAPGDVALVSVDDLPLVQGINSEVTVLNVAYSSTSRIVDIILDDSDKPFVLKAPQGYLGVFVGNSPTRYVSFGDSDGSLEIHGASTSGPLSSELVDKILVSFEHLHRSSITQLCVVDDGKLFVTGGADGVVCIWRVRRSREFWRLEQEAANVGHRAGSSITSLNVCKEQGLVVSGSDDCTATVWDLGRRQEFIRTLRGHKKAIRFVSVNSVMGDVLTVCEREARMWHVNGDMMASVEFKKYNLATPTSAIATPCYSYQPGVVMVIGHTNGDITLWDFLYPGDVTGSPRVDRPVSLELRALLRHGTSPVVALTLSRDKRMLVSGDLKGEVKRWSSAETILKRFRHLSGPVSGISSLPANLLSGAIAGRNSSQAGGGTVVLPKSFSSSSSDPKLASASATAPPV